MKTLMLSAIIAVTAMFAGTTTVEARDCCGKPIFCPKKEVCTEEVCRRSYCKTKCVFGKPRTIQFVEVTYKTTYVDCCGCKSTETWTKTYRCGRVK